MPPSAHVIRKVQVPQDRALPLSSAIVPESFPCSLVPIWCEGAVQPPMDAQYAETAQRTRRIRILSGPDFMCCLTCVPCPAGDECCKTLASDIHV
jgi:hypothetical protein